MMTKTDVAAVETLTDRGTVAGPGKFEGEMWYVVALWDLVLDGGADQESGEDPRIAWFKIDAELSAIVDDPERFPLGSFVGVWERSDGFVCRTDRGFSQDEIDADDTSDAGEV